MHIYRYLKSQENFYSSIWLKILSTYFSFWCCLYKNFPQSIPSDLPGSVLIPSIGTYGDLTTLLVLKKQPSPPMEMTSVLLLMSEELSSFSYLIVSLLHLLISTFSKTPALPKWVSFASILTWLIVGNYLPVVQKHVLDVRVLDKLRILQTLVFRSFANKQHVLKQLRFGCISKFTN